MYIKNTEWEQGFGDLGENQYGYLRIATLYKF